MGGERHEGREMKRWKYVLIAAVVIGLIVVGVWWLSQPGLKYDKSDAVEANWSALVLLPDLYFMDDVYVYGTISDLWYIEDHYEFYLYGRDGHIYKVTTNSPWRKWVNSACRKLSDGDKVVVWGYVNELYPDPFPSIAACVIEKSQ